MSPLLAHSGHALPHCMSPLLGVKRTSLDGKCLFYQNSVSIKLVSGFAIDPDRTVRRTLKPISFSEHSGDGGGCAKHDLGSPDNILFFGVFSYVVAAATDAWNE